MILLSLLAAVVLYRALTPSEPTFGGRNLSSWMSDLRADHDRLRVAEIRDALQKIGTNALPYVIHDLKSKDS